MCTAVTRPLARVNKQGPHAFVCPRGVAGCWLSWKSRTAAALPLVERIQFAFSLASIGANRGVLLAGEAEERWCECVADRERERISRVGGRRRRGESEQCLRHPLHLLLVGPAVAADGLLDLRRRVLDTGKARVRTGHEERASDLPDREGAPRIEAEERLLERDRVRPVLGEQRLKGQEQLAQPQLDPLIRPGLPAAVGELSGLRARTSITP